MNLPINHIGEKNWVKNLTIFLEDYDIIVERGELSTNLKLPKSMQEYYQNFGGIDSSDFMYNLYKINDLILLVDSDFEFIKENFSTELTKKFVVFSESPSNDPVCVNIIDETIHIFSHDPIDSKKVFENFEQYLKYEIIELQKLMGDVDFSKEEEIKYHKKHLNSNNIDYRYSKFC
ncbi:SMI1/KNR4 family protein [Tenacibaculum finnmarkense]|uniref:SMI1/KNR4 family protein n=1 Tax=Tenacibaculum finnmarkense TaxID=2781243 RepID=UPI00187B7AB1|nr:SMI1/KNR4 family protein [Tenacibaculum finnmarkense]MBE7649229.1 hypothetical protein [Tenacibaculum finnmarkense genomovar ulcerans]